MRNARGRNVFDLTVTGKRFIAGRAILRIILARYLNRPPGQVQFESGLHGKPALAPTMPSHDLIRRVGLCMQLRWDAKWMWMSRQYAPSRRWNPLRPTFIPMRNDELRALPAYTQAELFFGC